MRHQLASVAFLYCHLRIMSLDLWCQLLNSTCATQTQTVLFYLKHTKIHIAVRYIPKAGKLEEKKNHLRRFDIYEYFYNKVPANGLPQTRATG